MESGIIRGVESTPKEVLHNFLWGQLLLAGEGVKERGGKPPDPPSNTALDTYALQ